LFYYTTFEQGKLDRKSGIPSRVKFDGIPFTLRAPHDCGASEFDVFGSVNNIKERRSKSSSASSAIGAGGKRDSDTTSKQKKFPNEFLFVISLPKHFLQPLKGYEDDEGLFMVSSQVLSALKPQQFTGVVDGKPWADKVVLLQPHCILRSFLILPVEDTKAVIEYEMNLYDDKEVVYDKLEPLQSSIIEIKTIEAYTERMRFLRKEASSSNLIPLYHYTSPTVAPLILRGGLRMSTQGQGDGGVYVSTQGPASYGLGTSEYEVNIIKDCFGVERVNEYLGKGNLDVIIIYGCTAAVLEQTPGGRTNAKMVSKSTFESFSLQDTNKNYFLRPDHILGVFQVNHAIKLEVTPSIKKCLEVEKLADLESIDMLKKSELNISDNISRVDRSHDKLRSFAAPITPSSSSSLNPQGSARGFLRQPQSKSQSSFTGVVDDAYVSSENPPPPSLSSTPKFKLVQGLSFDNLGTSLDGHSVNPSSRSLLDVTI
jgi:hypothetical protein